jgi:biotin operon repressor
MNRKLAARFNPYRPNSLIAPGMFVGRLDEIRGIEQCLFQAKNGNPNHFLVQGERGIGKSSLFLYVEALAKGEVAPLSGASFKFITVSIDLGESLSQIDIIRKIGRGLRQEMGKINTLVESAKGFWEWLSNWEVLGVKFNKDQKDFDLDENLENFVGQLSILCKSNIGFDGVLFLVDEADNPPADAGLGACLKFITERLTRVQCNNVIFGLAGLPTLLSKIRESHESSPRLFHTMLLRPLEPQERIDVVKLGLDDANRINQIKTIIESDALEFLANLSEGYPHFVQQFAYSAFEHDDDFNIDEEDVGEGAFKDGGALSQLGDKFFSDMYHARISSEDYRRVLDAMAEYGDSWVHRKKIIAESGVSETNVANAFQVLKAKGIILIDDTRRGFYRLPTKSFGAWINAIRAARAKSDADSINQFEG